MPRPLRRQGLFVLGMVILLAIPGGRPLEAQAPQLAAAEMRMAERAGTATPAPATADAYPVAARELARGEVLTAADIRYETTEDGTDVAGEVTGSLVGWTTRRIIGEGERLRPPAVSPPNLVRAGETVQAVYRGRSVVLRVTGTAAGSAAMGERVLVRVDARRRLEGVVIGPALVQLDLNESS